MGEKFEKLKAILDENIQGVNRYNPENVNDLQQCVAAMASENKYDRDIALTTLKLYQLNPDKYDETTVRLILLKSLTVLPGSDFALAKCLIDANRLSSSDLKRVLDLGAILESCDFATFWKVMRGEYQADERYKNPNDIPKLVKEITGFEEAVRVYACKVIGATFQKIEKAQLVRLLGGASDAQVKAYATRFKWDTIEGGAAYFVCNHEATIRSRNIDEKLTFDSVHEILENMPMQTVIE